MPPGREAGGEATTLGKLVLSRGVPARRGQGRAMHLQCDGLQPDKPERYEMRQSQVRTCLPAGRLFGAVPCRAALPRPSGAALSSGAPPLAGSNTPRSRSWTTQASISSRRCPIARSWRLCTPTTTPRSSKSCAAAAAAAAAAPRECATAAAATAAFACSPPPYPDTSAQTDTEKTDTIKMQRGGGGGGGAPPGTQGGMTRAGGRGGGGRRQGGGGGGGGGRLRACSLSHGGLQC
eukprot:COSAG01_NODE_749_length_13846_cov_205.366097_1_plen_234_part_10